MKRVLFVDAGNYCRSPAAEVVARGLASKAGRAAEWRFGSAGLKDKHAGQPADPRSVEACRARGYELAAFRCREITAQDFFDNELVLAMDRENLAQLRSRCPPEAQVAIELFLGDEEVPDPYFGADDGFERMMDQIEAGARRLIAAR